MSAFIVESEVISGIVSFLARKRNLDSVRSLIYAETGHCLTTFGGRLAFGKALFELNCNAVNQRYGESAAAEYTYTATSPRSSVEAYKSIRCWLYQCSEGNVPETALYAVMEQVSDRLAHHIVSNLPEYERAAW